MTPGLEAIAAHLFPAISLGQRAVCRLIQGEPPEGDAQAALYARLLGRPWGDDLARVFPRVVIRAGRGASKSLMGEWFAVFHALTGDVSGLAPGELGHVLVVGPRKLSTKAVMGFVRGACESVPSLRADLLGEPMAESVRFRRGSEIEARAADKGGLSMRSVPVLAAVLDEANFFRDEATGVVNDKDIVEAAEARLVPGGQILLISSSWVETGLFFDVYDREIGKSREALVLNVDHPSLLNPAWRLPPGLVEGSTAYRREVLGEWVRDSSDSLATRDQVAACMIGRDAEDLPPEPRRDYRDALDLAGSGHRTGYAIGHVAHAGLVAEAGGVAPRFVVDALRGWTPTMPVEERFEAIRALRATYRVARSCAGDQFSFSAAQAVGRLVGVPLRQDTGKRPAQADAMAMLLREGRVSLPRSARLRAQFPAISLRRASGGGLSLVLPTQDAEGGHFDEAVAVMLLCAVLAPRGAAAGRGVTELGASQADWTGGTAGVSSGAGTGFGGEQGDPWDHGQP